MPRGTYVAASILAVSMAAPAHAQDFNIDGFRDTVIGAPGEDHGGKIDAGAVHVIYGNEERSPLVPPPQRWTLDSPGVPESPGDFDQFGFAVTYGRFNSDPYDDLAIGIPGRTVGSVSRAGAVLILYGGDAGLVADPLLFGFAEAPRFIVQGFSGIGGVGKEGDAFGFSLAAARCCDDTRYLAIGAPGVWAGSEGDHGRGEVFVIYNDAPQHAQVITQGNGSSPERRPPVLSSSGI